MKKHYSRKENPMLEVRKALGNFKELYCAYHDVYVPRKEFREKHPSCVAYKEVIP